MFAMPSPLHLARLCRAGAVLILLLSGAVAPAALAESRASDAPARAEIEGIVHDYILQHPEVIMEALSILQARQDAQEEQQQHEQLAARRDDLFQDTRSPVIGNPNGDVTLVEFMDYQCGYCKRMLDRVFQLVQDDRNLRVVFKEIPILGPASVTGARAALAAQAQGKYKEFHLALMGYRGTLTDDVVFDVARQVGLDVERLRRDMQSPEVAAELQRNMELAQALGIRGTPAFVVRDQVIPGAVSIDVLQQLIAQARQG